MVFRRKKTIIRRQGKTFQEFFDDIVRDALEKDPNLAKDLAFKSAGFSDILVVNPQSMDYPGINTPLAIGNNLIDPAEFVKQLKQEVLSGVGEAQHLWNFLLTAGFGQVTELLSSRRVPRQDQEHVAAINSSGGEAWINKVIELVGQAASES